MAGEEKATSDEELDGLMAALADRDDDAVTGPKPAEPSTKVTASKATAPPPAPATPRGSVTKPLSRGDAAELAELLARDMRGDSPVDVVFTHDSFWRYESGVYVPLPKRQLLVLDRDTL